METNRGDSYQMRGAVSQDPILASIRSPRLRITLQSPNESQEAKNKMIMTMMMMMMMLMMNKKKKK
jgi:hypothetical protein